MNDTVEARTWHAVGSTDTFEIDAGTARVIDGKRIAIFRTAEGFFAIDDLCTHDVASLAEGWVEDGCVECPLHQARFNLASGAVEAGPAWQPVTAYPTRLEGAILYVGVAPCATREL